MSEHTLVYVECENMCKEEGMTKGQILKEFTTKAKILKLLASDWVKVGNKYEYIVEDPLIVNESDLIQLVTDDENLEKLEATVLYKKDSQMAGKFTLTTNARPVSDVVTTMYVKKAVIV